MTNAGARTQAALPSFSVMDMEDAHVSDDSDEAGFVVTNPPWGVRLGDPAESEALYRRMGILRKKFPHWKIVVLSDHPGFETFFGAKAASCKPLSNGAVQTYLYEF
jgi:putative N6-adenine-specific DNA methylase